MKDTTPLIQTWRPLMLKIFHDFAQPLGTLMALWPSLVSSEDELGHAAQDTLNQGVQFLTRWRNLWAHASPPSSVLKAFFAPHLTFENPHYLDTWDPWVLWTTALYWTEGHTDVSTLFLEPTTLKASLQRPLTQDSFIFPLWQALTQHTYTLTQNASGTYLKKI